MGDAKDWGIEVQRYDFPVIFEELVSERLLELAKDESSYTAIDTRTSYCVMDTEIGNLHITRDVEGDELILTFQEPQEGRPAKRMGSVKVAHDLYSALLCIEVNEYGIENGLLEMLLNDSSEISTMITIVPGDNVNYTIRYNPFSGEDLRQEVSNTANGSSIQSIQGEEGYWMITAEGKKFFIQEMS